MAWVRYSHASVNPGSPRALGMCDRCGFVFQRDSLDWQYQWQGPKLQNRRILVCDNGCMDVPQEQLRTIIVPPDPIPISNPRPDPHMLMLQSSTPPGYASGAPNVLVTESGDFLTTESGIPLITEINVTPSPTSSGYTIGTSGFGST